jgi:hypothetical protein
MKLVLTLAARDEEEIIEANLDHHLAHGVDFVIVTDNGSVDGTRAILQRYERAGCLRLLDEPVHDRAQHRWVTRMARLAATEHGADWIINSDVDEFWVAAGAGDLHDVLAAVPDDTGAISASRFNFVARPQDGRPFHERLTVRHATSVNELGQVLHPKLAHRADADIVVRQGNHEIESRRLGPVVADGSLEILHFPQLSWERFDQRVTQGGEAYESNPDLPPGAGLRYRTWYALQKEGRLRAEWDRLHHDDADIEAGLASGELVEDRRLADRMVDLSRTADVSQREERRSE